MNFILDSDLLNPPSQTTSVRSLLMMLKISSKTENLVETQKEFLDIYYRFLKHTGLFDFVDDLIVEEDNVQGLRLARCHRFPMTIIVDRIDAKNDVQIIGQLAFLRKTD